jgi:signal transduction histidine kinase
VLGSRLARRIVLPVLILICVLFALLAASALWIADRRVEQELVDTADRVAATLDGLRVAPEHRRAILPALGGLVGTEVVVGGDATNPDWTPAELEDLAPGAVRMGERDYRVLERRSARGPDRYLVLFDSERVTQRRRDVIGPVAVAGACGLLLAALIGLFVARTIARPVKRLADRTQRFAEGEDPAAPARPGPGEIGELEDTFLRMVHAVREGEARLRESERFAALGRVVGGVAHELRNPLTAIRMAVETATGEDAAGRLEARNVAVAEIERLDRTLRGMLDYVRPREPALEEVDVRALVADVATLLRPQCDHLRVTLDVEVHDDAGSVRADPDRLKQALVNLVLNGAQAQPHGGAVRLRGARGLLAVEDDGPGFPEEISENPFLPFVTTREGGIGLGLAVVRQVADEHGAKLGFETGPGGTVFTLRFATA